MIIAFGMSFYIILHKTTEIDVTEDSNDNAYPYFDDLGFSLVKAVTMGIGELEFSDLPFGLDGLKYTVLLAFILIIMLSVMNLINGLAVYDVKEISDEAEHLVNKSQVETLRSLVSSSVNNLYNVISHVYIVIILSTCYAITIIPQSISISS